MKYTLVLLLLAGITTYSFSQEDATQIQKEIDQQIWKVFAETYNNLDAKGFNAIHADDVIRSGPGTLRVGEEYKNQNRESFQRVKQRGEKRTISFTMESRQTREDLSYEVGYYKVSMQPKEGEARHFYGRFHVVIKKIDGQWKIVQDWDTGSILGKKIDEEAFQSGTPLKF